MNANELEAKLQVLSNALVEELITLTPETMREIHFEIVGTDDGSADIGLLENHPDAKHVVLSDAIYHHASRYLPLIKQYVPKWKRTLFVLLESADGWDVSARFERE